MFMCQEANLSKAENPGTTCGQIFNWTRGSALDLVSESHCSCSFSWLIRCRNESAGSVLRKVHSL